MNLPTEEKLATYASLCPRCNSVLAVPAGSHGRCKCGFEGTTSRPPTLPEYIEATSDGWHLQEAEKMLYTALAKRIPRP